MRISLNSAEDGDMLDVAATCIDSPEAFDAWVTRAMAAASALWPGRVIALSVPVPVPEDGAGEAGAADPVAASPDAAAPVQNAPAENAPAQNAPAQNAPAHAAPELRSPREGSKLSYVVEAVLEGKSVFEIAKGLGDGVDVDRIKVMIGVARTKGYLPARGRL